MPPAEPSPDDWLLDAAALAQIDAWDAADALFRQRIAAFPDLPDRVFHLIETAAAAGEAARTEALIAGSLRRYAELGITWIIAQRALRQVGRFDAACQIGDAGLARHPSDIGILVERASTAEHVGDLPTVKRLCATIRALEPTQGDALTIEMRASRALGDTAHADTVAAAAHALGVRYPGVLVEQMYAARRKRDTAALFALAETLIEAEPGVSEAYLLPIDQMLESGTFDAAIAMFARVPEDLRPKAAFDRLSVLLLLVAGQLEDAYARSVEATARHPEDAELHGLRAAATREVQRGAELQAFVAEAINRFPNEPRLVSEHALQAELAGEPEHALERWRRLSTVAPQSPDGFAHAARVLIALRRDEDAERELATALARFPESREVLKQYATAAQVRNDWAEAEHRWQLFEARFPGDADVRGLIAEMRVARALESLDADALLPAHAGHAETPMAELFIGFESLGADCEFGLVQRHFGVEPLGLLRWASAAPDSLALMLEDRLDGVGDAENVLLRVDPNGEYAAGDHRYFVGHTFVTATSTPHDRMLRTITRRLKFLKDKLLTDLAEGEKIFVYLSTATALPDDVIHRLHRAIRGHGRASFLCVRKSPELSREGIVTRLDDGLFLGHILAPEDEGHEPRRHAQSWAAICQWVRAQAGGQAPPA